MAAIEIIRGDQIGICLQLGSQSIPLPALWLRERAQSGTELDAQTRQRLFNPHDLDPDLTLLGATRQGHQIHLQFSDGYSGDYDLSQLLRLATDANPLPAKILWRSDMEPLRFDWNFLSDPSYLLQTVTGFLQYGFIIIENSVPTDQGFSELAAKFGFVKDTAHGQSYQLVSKPDYNDLGYQPVALSPHTDMPYSNPMPGVQILQCRVNETSGGFSTLVDSVACCEQLRQEDPDAYQILADLCVQFRFDSAEESIVLDRPLLDIDSSGELQGVRYSPRVDYMPLVAEEQLRNYQRARKKLASLFTSAKFEVRFQLQSGEAVMFDNSRILHGRTAYNPNEGLRHLEGCYLDRDGPAIRYHTLKRDGHSQT